MTAEPRADGAPATLAERIVAIDGPSGSGKSTVSRGVANALGLEVLDTGAMYRALTLLVIERAVDPTDGEACARLAREMALEVGTRTILEGRDVSQIIRGPEVTAMVSTVSAQSSVREVLVERQRAWVAGHGGGVVEGRDIGTVVFPDATLKVFLTASDDERARRRHRDEEGAARSVAVSDVKAALERRDAIDSGRAVSPLRAANDAVVIDTTGAHIDTVIGDIVSRVRAAEET
jgi:CMP/dCMP kinase